MNTTKKALGFKAPNPVRIEGLLIRLNEARNELDALTFEAEQPWRETLYSLNDCIEKLEKCAKP